MRRILFVVRLKLLGLLDGPLVEGMADQVGDRHHNGLLHLVAGDHALAHLAPAARLGRGLRGRCRCFCLFLCHSVLFPRPYLPACPISRSRCKVRMRAISFRWFLVALTFCWGFESRSRRIW